jgi:putative endopeptidase
MFELLGDDPQAAAKEAMTVLTFERHLAEASMTLVEQGDPSATYHKFARAGLAAATPGFDWEAYFTAIGMPAAAVQFLVRQPGFFREVAAMAQSVPLADWKTYLRWRLIEDSASKLDAKFENEHFAWNGNVLQGLKEPGPRWKRVEEVVQQGAGFALGQLFVERASSAARRFSKISKAFCLARAHPGAGMDDPGNEGKGLGKTGGLRGQDRLSGQMARRLGPNY